jgi:GntR family transcriptional repressor for pyruvate dehydrogenase complex
MLKAVQHVSVTDSVYAALKELIVNGNFEPGTKFLTESEISKRLSVGRSTVREAIRMLVATGYLENRPGKGAFLIQNKALDELTGISQIFAWFSSHEAELEDYLEVRRAVEPLAARLAAQKADAEILRKLEETHGAFVKALEAQDSAAMARNDERFHALIFEASRNPLLLTINLAISKFLAEYRVRSFSILEDAPHALSLHRELLDCIERKDPDKAANVMIEHIKVSVVDIMKSARR